MSCVVHIIQVKVWFRWRLNLIVIMISLSNHMMTSQDHARVECVGNGIPQDGVWSIMNNDMLPIRCIHAVSVRNNLPVSIAWGCTWMFTAINTSAQAVESVLQAKQVWLHTVAFILERSRLNVLFAASNLQHQVVLLGTAEFTVERNHTNVLSVTRHSVCLAIFTLTWESTRETNYTSVQCVMPASASPATCKDTNVMHTATEDLMTVVTVGRCLKVAIIWSVMFILTLLQSHTHVLTVRTVSRGMTNSRHICWSHTMKVLGSHVTVVILSSIYVVIKVWNRMFAATVQSVSTQRAIWDLISWCTRILSISAVLMWWILQIESVCCTPFQEMFE